MNPKIYSEVDCVIESLDIEYKNKIPPQLLQLIKAKKIRGYKPNIDIKKSLYEQGVEHDTLALLAMIYYNCWCNDDNEKKELLKILMDNKKNN